MTRPPVFASALLRWVTPPDYLQFIQGDLDEEFYQYRVARQGPRAARSWYSRQVFRSVFPIVVSRLSVADWQISCLVILLASAVQTVAFDWFWSLMLSQVPLKADLVRGSDYLVVSLFLTALFSCVAGTLIVGRALALAIPLGCVF